jgi:putative ABC transport system ATP-binding protein
MASVATVTEPVVRHPLVEVRNLSREYAVGTGTVVALHNIDFDVAAQEWVAITGPSGSGKTTLVNLLAGLDRPTTGTIHVRGQDLTSLTQSQLTSYRAHQLGLVFQDPHLLPGLTAIENVVAARLPWARGSELEPRGRALLEQVGLEHRAGFPPARLSGGERQRVAIARALLGEPALLLADEPTGNLDRAATIAFLDLLWGLRASMGLTLIVATHDPLVAERASRVLVLDDVRRRLRESQIRSGSPA